MCIWGKHEKRSIQLWKMLSPLVAKTHRISSCIHTCSEKCWLKNFQISEYPWLLLLKPAWKKGSFIASMPWWSIFSVQVPKHSKSMALELIAFDMQISLAAILHHTKPPGLPIFGGLANFWNLNFQNQTRSLAQNLTVYHIGIFWPVSFFQILTPLEFAHGYTCHLGISQSKGQF